MPLITLTSYMITILVSSLVTLASGIYTVRRFSSRKNAGSTPSGGQNATLNPRHSTTRRLLFVPISAHTIYMLYKILVECPQNIFRMLDVPLDDSSENVRRMLLRKAKTEMPPKSLELLRACLESFDMQVAYARFGHSVVQDCDYCTTLYDYTFHAVPLLAMEYIFMAFVVGIVTCRGSGHDGWRFWALTLLTALGMLEVAYLHCAGVSFSPTSTQESTVHETALRLRRLLFLVLPPMLYLLPWSSRSLSPPQVLPDLGSKVEQTTDRSRFLELAFAVRSRYPELRASADIQWESQRKEGQISVSGPVLQETAEKLEIRIYGDWGALLGLREKAKTILERFKHEVPARD